MADSAVVGAPLRVGARLMGDQRLEVTEAALREAYDLIVETVGLVCRGGSIHEAADLLDKIRKSRTDYDELLIHKIARR